MADLWWVYVRGGTYFRQSMIDRLQLTISSVAVRLTKLPESQVEI